uniref:Putative secreted protein n=1 Tax=Anopheles darlingi TaxID=43151 RepID=A0A2M4DNA9_ANODA
MECPAPVHVVCVSFCLFFALSLSLCSSYLFYTQQSKECLFRVTRPCRCPFSSAIALAKKTTTTAWSARRVHDACGVWPP